jgi:large subunit ribosomal protein L19
MNLSSIIETKPNPDIPELFPGDTVKVHTRIIEGEKERTQVFQGVVIAVRPDGNAGNFVVRRVTYGIGVERTFPFLSPLVRRVEVMRHGKVRRANLYYLRGLSTKASRIKERQLAREGEAVEAPAEVATESQPETPK